MQLREDHSEIDEAVAPFVSTALGADLRGGDHTATGGQVIT